METVVVAGDTRSEITAGEKPVGMLGEKSSSVLVHLPHFKLGLLRSVKFPDYLFISSHELDSVVCLSLN